MVMDWIGDKYMQGSRKIVAPLRQSSLILLLSLPSLFVFLDGFDTPEARALFRSNQKRNSKTIAQYNAKELTKRQASLEPDGSFFGIDLF